MARAWRCIPVPARNVRSFAATTCAIAGKAFTSAGARIFDSGGEKGVAIDINGETEAVVIAKNELRESRKPSARVGILIGAETRDIRCMDNRIEGFATPISDLRKA